MKKVILAPDSFKGTMSSREICDIMSGEILKAFPDCEIHMLPVADGGEGTVDCFLCAVEGERRTVEVNGPFFEKVQAFYGVINNGKTAVVEMAAAAGLPMAEGRLDPSVATTYGVGELMLHAVESGVEEIILGMGGSATNDGGCGAAAALGVRFKNAQGEEFIPTGATLSQIAEIDTSKARERLDGIRLTAMCDVENPLFGKTGAAYVFAPQKGADEKMVELLDEGLRHYGEILDKLPGGQGVSALPGAGAAGGLGAGVYALLGASLTSGIQTVLDTVGFDARLDGCDMVFTGEGRIDGQSLKGKVVLGVSRRAAKANVPVCAVVGDALDDGLEQAYEQGLTSVITINRMAIPFSQAKPRAKEDLRATMRNIVSLLATR